MWRNYSLPDLWGYLMPSTDIGGGPILILTRQEASLIFDAMMQVHDLKADELEVLEKLGKFLKETNE